MPELTAVQYMTENLVIWLQNNRILSFSSSMPKYQHVEDFFSQSIEIIEIYRRGKNSVLITTKGVVIIEYNLSGNICWSDTATGKFMRGYFCLERGDFLIFSDKINLAKINIFADITDKNAIETKLSQKLGPEFWPKLPNGAWWKQTLKGQGKGTQLLYVALQQQKKVAGIGNIIAIETLWRSKISPQLSCKDIADMQWDILAEQIGHVIEISMSQHRSMRTQEQSKAQDAQKFSGILHLVSEGKHRAEGYSIYGRKGEICPQCQQTEIMKTKMGHQPLYWCPHCQKTS